MKLKNSALQELYDAIVNSTITISPYEASPIDKAFKECDEKLSESITFAHIKDLEDRNDILEQSNKHLLKHLLEAISKTRKLEKEIEELKKQNENLASQYQKLTIENKRLQDANTTLEKASDDRTNLQEVSDYYYFGGDDEFDTDDCEMTSMTDIIDNLNVDQFLEAYKNWHKAQEQHRLDHMRDWLHDFCANRFCEGCPLASNEYKCGRGYSFKGAKPIPDEDVKRYYEKASACRKTWTCTLEGTIEIDKDLLNKICGIDSDD